MSIRLLNSIDRSNESESTFEEIVKQINTTKHTIDIHMFVWRNDKIGNSIGQAIFDAAERGVKIEIIKDSGAIMYEHIEMNRHPFFKKTISLKKQIIYRLLQPFFPNTDCAKEFSDNLSEKIIAHQNVSITWVEHTHIKYFIFDKKTIITGSTNIEARHLNYYDYDICISDPKLIEHLMSRQQLKVEYEPAKGIDFIVNTRINQELICEIKSTCLTLMELATDKILIEMAYIGDPDITDKIIELSNRGVSVVILFSREANIGNDINYSTLHHIYLKANIEVYLTKKMIHSKLMMIDEEYVVVGSANFSVFSMQKSEELDLVIHSNEEFIQSVKECLLTRMSESTKVESLNELKQFNPIMATLQQLHQRFNQLFN